MRGDQCPYSHAANPKAKANPQGTSPHAPAGAKVTAAVAIMASVSQAAATLPSSTQVCLDYVGDTGAGECLGSVEAFRRQGFDIPDELITSTNHPVQFLTGGGSKAGTSTIGFWSQEFERMSNVYLLPQCPLALSIGQLCQEGYTFLWSGQSLPMLIPPSTQFDYMVDGPVLSADRVEHNVPIFRLSIECTYGMPASASSSAAGPPPDVPVGGENQASLSLTQWHPSNRNPLMALRLPRVSEGKGEMTHWKSGKKTRTKKLMGYLQTTS